jgi:hypothetical protein
MTMEQETENRLRIAYEIRRPDIEAVARLCALFASSVRQPRPIRRAIGRSIISIGRRVAAEPLQPVRSR